VTKVFPDVGTGLGIKRDPPTVFTEVMGENDPAIDCIDGLIGRDQVSTDKEKRNTTGEENITEVNEGKHSMFVGE
jgi:hypothetical protein